MRFCGLFLSRKMPNNAVTPQRQSQFTPKMKANMESRLLSSLGRIDQDSECNQLTSPIIFGKMHLLLYQKMSFFIK